MIKVSIQLVSEASDPVPNSAEPSQQGQGSFVTMRLTNYAWTNNVPMYTCTYVVMICHAISSGTSNAPINVKPHLPHPGDMWGLDTFGSRLPRTSGRATSQILVEYCVIQAIRVAY